MIIGIGQDLCDIQRIEKTLKNHGKRFEQRCFTMVEQQRSNNRASRAGSYAKRFAAKEACAKALGTGFSRGVFWRDIGVVNLPGGQPTLVLTGGALKRLQSLTPLGYCAAIYLTMTDEYPLASALVMIESHPL